MVRCQSAKNAKMMHLENLALYGVPDSGKFLPGKISAKLEV